MEQSLYIIDLYSFVFRAFFAIRSLNAPDGTPVNAVFGVANMLNKLFLDKKPDHVVICADAKEKGFREDIYPEYKANRDEVPEDLVPQFALIDELIERLAIPVMRVPGFEADDLIATLTKKFAYQEHIHVFIVSSDKDLMQLVSDKNHVCIYDTMKNKMLKESDVLEKFGVTPDKVVDVQSLCGDSSDNIPGVHGVGPKTAAKLVNEFGSLENVLENAAAIKGKIGEKIAAEKDQALLSRKLVALRDDILLDIRFEDLAYPLPDAARMNPFYEKLGFRTLIQEANKPVHTPSPQKSQSFTAHTLDSEESVLKMLSSYQKLAPHSFVAFDTETTALDSHQAGLVGVSLCFDNQNAYYIPVAHKTGQNVPLSVVLNHVGPLLSDPKIPKVAQNAKFDMNMLTRHGFNINGLSDDTLLAAYLLNPEGSHDLDTLAQKYLGHTTIKFADVVAKGKNFSDVPVDLATRYAAEDAWVAFSLHHELSSQIKKQEIEKIYRDIEVPLIPVLSNMELSGILVDQNLLDNLKVEFDQRLAELEKQVHALAGQEFNLNSPKQLAEILFVKLGLPPQRKTKTGYSTDVDVLSTLSHMHDLPKKLLDYRTITKLNSTYVIQLKNLINPQTQRVHTTFNQTIAATGRLSSTDPNLQNIPIKTQEGRRIRQVFIAPPEHVLFSADYSQIELRLLAAFSKDPELMSAYQQGLDIHKKTASSLFGVSVDEITNEMRSIGKTVNFGVIYGQSPFGLAQQLGVPQREAKRFIESFYENFSSVHNYREQILLQARQNGFVSTYLGRKRPVPEINSQNMMNRQNAERVAFNTVFQGSAADLIKKAMITIHAELTQKNLKTKMLLQVHDELIFEVPLNELNTIESLVPPIMENAFTLEVPLVVSFSHGKNWGEAH